jgi:hypothetical protein
MREDGDLYGYKNLVCFSMEELVFASAHDFSICHVFLRSQAPFLFSTVSDFVCTLLSSDFSVPVYGFKSSFSKARQFDFLFGASSPGSVRFHTEGCSLDFVHCCRFSWFIAASRWFPI